MFTKLTILFSLLTLPCQGQLINYSTQIKNYPSISTTSPIGGGGVLSSSLTVSLNVCGALQAYQTKVDLSGWQCVTLSFANLSGSLMCSQMPALTGKTTLAGGTCLTALNAKTIDLLDYSPTPASHSGMLPIWDQPSQTYIPGDPLMQGTQAPASTIIPNPLVSGGSDYGGTPAIRTQKVDANGNAYIVLASAPTLTVSLPPQPFLNVADFSDVAAGTPARGDMITVPSTGKWTRFGLGSTNTIYQSNGTDLIASTTISPSKLSGAVICDGTVNTTLNAAVAAVSGTGSVIIPLGSQCPVNANLSVPSTVSLVFLSGSAVNIPNGVTLTPNGPIVASLGQQIFNFTGTGAVAIGSNAIQNVISPVWWGACLGLVDDSVPTNAMITAIKNFARPMLVQFPTTSTGCIFTNEIVADGLIGVHFAGPTNNGGSGLGAGKNVIQLNGTVSPLFSCSGCQDVTITGFYFFQGSASFAVNGVIIEFGPTQSTQIKIEDNVWDSQSTNSGVVFLSLNNVNNALIRNNQWGGNATATSSVYVRGAISNSSGGSNRVTFDGNSCNPGVAAVNGHVCFQNFLGQTVFLNNTCELGNGTGLICIGYTAGPWTGGFINTHEWIGGFVGDGGTSNTQTMINYPGPCSNIQFHGIGIAGNTTNSNFFNFGNSCSQVVIDGVTELNGNLIGTWATIGTGVSIDIGQNSFIGTTSTFLSGTPVGGKICDNSSPSICTSYGPFNTYGQADIVVSSGSINTVEAIIVKTPAFPANRIIAGTHFRVILDGTCTSTVANASTFTLRWGTNGTTADGTVATFTTSAAATSGTNNGFRAVIDLTVRTVGASATSQGMLQLTSDGNIGIVATPNVKSVAGTAFNTTTASAILSLGYRSAATTTTSTFTNATIEIVQN